MADVDQVAQNFAQHYYQVFSANRSNLSALYVLAVNVLIPYHWL